ncbi:MAG: archease [Methanocorpusculum sp.]|nr:archease [Methanocorpusculum sp.]MDE2523679.1 archease [Methanocorpusculum sp.]
MTFEELEHTADVRMKIIAPTLPELYAESGFALAETLYGGYQREPATVSFPIKAGGKDAEERAVNFLSELLFLTETEYLVPVSFDLAADGNAVCGTVSGVLFDRTKHAGGIGVKGISYSGISLTKTAAGYELIIIFDI